MGQKTIVICGGGTGGHLYPALALSDALLRREQNVRILIAGPGKNKEQVMRYNNALNFFSISAAPLSGTAFMLPKNLAVLGFGFFQAASLLVREKPVAVVGMGAYSSVPVALAASILKIPVFLHEQNVIPGKATRLLSRFARKIFLSFESSASHFPARKDKFIVSGNPVRRVSSSVKKADVLLPLGFSETKKTMLVFGGSHGAKKINDAVSGMLDFLSSQDDFQMIHVSGRFDFERIKEMTSKAPHLKNYHVAAYLDNLMDFMAAADLVVCRAGATTCAELLALAKPSVLIPYPYAANQHQLKNAEALERAGAARILRDENVNAETFKEMFLEILMNDAMLSQMAEACRKNAKEDAGSRMADEILRP